MGSLVRASIGQRRNKVTIACRPLASLEEREESESASSSYVFNKHLGWEWCEKFVRGTGWHLAEVQGVLLQMSPVAVY